MGFSIGTVFLDWIGNETIHLDGGAMFGVVPKVLWSKEYPCDELNRCPLANNPILICVEDKKILLESGLGNKLSSKNQDNFGVRIDQSVVQGLIERQITTEEIDMVILSHLDWDHASGLTYLNEKGELKIRFPNAVHICSQVELDGLSHLTNRLKKGYWEDNFRPLLEEGQLIGISDGYKIDEFFQLRLTGGHRAGHMLVRIEQNGSVAYYFGDLLPTVAHYKPLWVSAYDDYPLTSIERKEYWFDIARKEKAWVLLYHDIKYQAVLFDSEGKIADCITRKH
jgi:glyoxylase-like metal-dependent hydrolase (beta-lactamase superfamily II)